MRFQKLTRCMDLRTQSGLEIGALTHPVITRDMGRVFYVDHASTAELRAKYAGNPTVDPARLVEVDYVWGARSLAEATGKTAAFDYVLASHVIEHVPDLIGWLNEVHAVLRPGGILTLAVPDKRFTFDVYRHTTVLAEVVDASLRRVRRPTARQVFDHHFGAVQKNGHLSWNALAPGDPVPIHGLDYALSAANRAELHGEYVDVHCWVFTPSSFCTLLAQLTWLGLVHLGPKDFHGTEPTDSEFFVTLEALAPTSDPEERLRRAQRFTALVGTSFDLRDWRTLDPMHAPSSFREPAARWEARLRKAKGALHTVRESPVRGTMTLVRRLATRLRSPR